MAKRKSRILEQIRKAVIADIEYRGLSNTFISNKSGVSASTIRNFRNTKKKINHNFSTVDFIAKTCGLTVVLQRGANDPE